VGEVDKEKELGSLTKAKEHAKKFSLHAQIISVIPKKFL
jgi:hypothetical protein